MGKYISYYKYIQELEAKQEHNKQPSREISGE